jgi:phosphatidylglycerophosphatase A
MVAQTKNSSVLQFWFDKVPLLDMAIVLPGLTLAMVSGTGLTIVRYGGLAHAPQHILMSFWALVVFAVWWGLTDLTTQGSALNAVLAATAENENNTNTSNNNEMEEVPDEVTGRVVSNVVSCVLVLLLYGIMVLKPGTIRYW